MAADVPMAMFVVCSMLRFASGLMTTLLFETASWVS